jgi:hypothetical protein
MKVLYTSTVERAFLETGTAWFLQKVQSSIKVSTAPNISLHA